MEAQSQPKSLDLGSAVPPRRKRNGSLKIQFDDLIQTRMRKK